MGKNQRLLQLGATKKTGKLFREVLDKDYTEEDYEVQFEIRVSENLAKIERMREIYETKVTDAPQVFYKLLNEQAERLKELKGKHGNCVSPFKFIEQ